MSDPIKGVKVEGNCFISNYAMNGKAKQNNRFGAWYDANSTKPEIFGNKDLFGTTGKKSKKEYKRIINEVAKLDGDAQTLSVKDLEKLSTNDAKEMFANLAGIDGAKNIFVDLKRGLLRIILKTGELLRIDFQVADESPETDYSSDKMKIELKKLDKLCEKFKKWDMDVTVDLVQQNGEHFYKIKFNKPVDVLGFKCVIDENLTEVSEYDHEGRLAKVKGFKDIITRNPKAPSNLDMAWFMQGKTLMLPVNMVRIALK